jgi:hypothetical protein
MLAYLDESGSDSKKDPDTYLLVAALCSDLIVDPTRASLSSLRLKGQLKLHWRDESAGRPKKIASLVAGLPVEHLVVVYNAHPGEKIERRRRRCLERILFELDQRQTTIAVFESRGPADDRRDRELMTTLRTKGAVSAALRMEHVPGPAEPMLWIPDSICGSVVSARCGQDLYLRTIEAGAPVEQIPI